MIVIVTATFSEAKALVEYFGLVQTQKKPFSIYKNDKILLIISGIGKVNSAIATTYAFSTYKNIDNIINFGICGSSDKEKEIGSFWNIKSVIDKDSDKKFILKKEGEILWCHSKAIIFPLSKKVLVDMESSGFLQAAKTFINTKNISIYKIVSDHLDIKEKLNENILKDIVKNSIFKMIYIINEKIGL